ncbi:radical SAM family heme chaperone HemW [Halieaceae bacterium IMCC8485]|jgi:oxygen-independent coproporphyrinogen-3 oxidase|uniref:Heme chaperone HemW n=1 Tax=Candidatus Seongchinamella marina TaxID=2518990 RepID=A0ABT3SWZ2_9GAMM|nr:radical SAM family heme chaperone HemW [Candidatus Seongchinamella marina]MCX2973784.1 radical SAM family heme chaperone HemW [Candidatus Seongchinamella marina]
MSLPPLSLYIHLPWCERKCPYCDFNSHESSHVPEQAYITALLQDLDADLAMAAGREIQTLFIGGGTPSLFSAEAISRLLAGIGDRLELAPDAEATMEANPGSAEADKFLGFRQAGINRLSLGVQSFQDDKLGALGRVHDSKQARAAIEYASAAGFDSFNIDLMHGLPGQTEADAIYDLETAISFHPPHLSWYQLTIEPNTVFNKRPPTLPVEDALADIQDRGELLLENQGYAQYEVSAYSRPELQCQHNLNYWSFGDYLALGAGAHGKITAADGSIRRYAKTRAPQDYLQGKRYTASKRVLNQGELIGEFMMFALRLNNGFSTQRFEQVTGLSADQLRPKVQSLADRELLSTDRDNIRATPLGRRFLDSVIAEFLPND